MDLTGRVAVVTGGASGIGAATVAALRSAGALPVSWDLQENADVRCDVSDRDQVSEALRETRDRHGTPTLLVTAAGVGAISRPVADLPAADLNRTLAINTYGVVWCLQAVARALMTAKLEGSLVVVSSANGTVADEGLAAYSMSKAAINMAVRIMAREVGPFGIRVNAVAPGPVDTPMLAGLLGEPGYADEITRRTPLGRVGAPEDIAESIVHLLGSSWITGQIVAVDGGSSLTTGRSSWSPREAAG